MVRAVVDDHYAVLGVARTATAGEVRRAFRTLALRHHPDRAGAASTVVFQRISAAYQVLSDPAARATYDGDLSRTGEPRGHGREGNGWGGQARPIVDLLERLSGPLERLVASGAARHAGDGAVELVLTRDEAAQGGVAALDLPVPVSCPTCWGGAERGRLWCRRCEYAGTVLEEVTVCIPLRAPEDGVVYAFPTDASGTTAPLRVRIRVK